MDPIISALATKLRLCHTKNMDQRVMHLKQRKNLQILMVVIHNYMYLIYLILVFVSEGHEGF